MPEPPAPAPADLPTRLARIKAQSARFYHDDPARALALGEEAVALAAADGDAECLALALWTRGNARMFLDRYLQAAEDFEAARRLYLDRGRADEAARLAVGQVWALAYLGEFEAAQRLAAEAQEVLTPLAASSIADRRRLAGLVNNLGIVYELQGRYEEALEAYSRKREMALTLDDPFQAARADLNRAFALAALNEYAEAERVLLAAQAAFEAAGARADAARAAFNRGCLLSRRGRFAEALAAFDQARSILATLEGMENQAAEVALHWAEALLGGGEPADEAALDALHRAQALFARHGPLLEEGEAWLLLGLAHLSRGELAAARRSLAQAQEIARRLGPASLAWRVWHLRGRVAEAAGDASAADQAYEQAIQTIEGAQSSLRIDAFRAAFLEDKLAVYHDAILLALRQGQPERALEIVERAHARALVDLLAGSLDRLGASQGEEGRADTDALALRDLRRQLADLLRQARLTAANGPHWRLEEAALDRASLVRLRDLEQKIRTRLRRLERRNPRYAALQTPLHRPLDQVRRHLAEDALALVYAAVHDEWLLFAVSRRGLEGHYRLGSRAAVETARLAWRAALERFLWLQAQMGAAYVERHWDSLLAGVQKPAQALYAALLAPAADLLARYRCLVVVPDAELHYLPFQALYDGAGYLLERRSLRYLPSLTTLALGSPPRPGGRGQALVLAYSAGGRLPSVAAEAQAVASAVGPLFAGIALYCEEQAGRAALTERAGEYELLHLATHSRFRADDPLFSSLELADGPLWVYDLYRLRLRASLVTLSACDTGQGTLRGRELLGLTRGFLSAGAASVLVSLWAVDDRSTAALMGAFYRHLGAGATRSEALRAAQLGLLRGERLVWRHPAHWAAFCLVGAEGQVGNAEDAEGS
ncbi:MAG TPA: CHAT domain-containing protein [Anaerolineae bacterium]|nr:CHAT domain-containing protein [Anaerolineae bacterium]